VDEEGDGERSEEGVDNGFGEGVDMELMWLMKESLY
jgi:hypothetical protein